MGQELNREFSTEEAQIAKKTFRNCSASLIIRKMVIIRKMENKITLRYHITPVRMARIKNTDDSLCWRGCEIRGTLLHYLWE